MSFISVVGNFTTKEWAVNTDALGSIFCDLMIGFTNSAGTVEFENLMFGYELVNDGQVVKSEWFPPPGITFLSSQNQHLVSTRLEVNPLKTYELRLWVENFGERFETSYTFTTPEPQDDGETFESSRPYPTDGRDYIWNPDGREWVLKTE